MKNQFERIENNAFKNAELIQAHLISAYFEKQHPTNEECFLWIANHANNFRNFINNHPEYLTIYAIDKKEAIEKIGEELYKDRDLKI